MIKSAISNGRLIPSVTHSAPATKSSESPGRNGAITTPVSVKMMANSSA